jgi:hypothetical protein
MRMFFVQLRIARRSGGSCSTASCRCACILDDLLDKAKVKTLVADCFVNYGPELTAEVVDRLKYVVSTTRRSPA